MIDIQKSRNIFNKVIKTVLKLSEMHAFKCEDYLIAPSDVATARSLLVKDHTFYHISDVAWSVLAKCKVNDDSNTMKVDIEQTNHKKALTLLTNISANWEEIGLGHDFSKIWKV